LCREVGENIELDRAQLNEGLAVGAVEHKVFGDRESLDKSVSTTVFGYEAHALIENLPNRLLDERDAIQRSVAPCSRLKTHDRLNEFGLPVSLNSRNADDLARLDIERDVINDDVSDRVDDGQVVNDKSRFSR